MICLRGLVAATGAALGLFAATAQAMPPVLDRVPTDALVVITTPSLDRLDRSSTALTGALNLPIPIPRLQEALAMGGFEAGLDKTKSAAAVIMPGDMDADVPPMVILLPVTDYSAVVTNLGGTATAGVDEVMIDGDAAYFRNLGDGYAVMSPLRELAEGFAGRAGNAKAHEAALGKTNKAIADASDLLIIANIEAIRPLAEPHLAGVLEGMMAATPMGMMGAEAPNMEAAEQALTAFVQQARTAVVGVKADGAGLSIDLGAQFIDGSFLARTFARGGEAGSLMKSLPKQPYYLAGAIDLSSPGMKQLVAGAMEMNRRQMEDMLGEEPPAGMFFMQPEQMEGAAFVLGASPGVMMGGGLLTNTVAFIKTQDATGYVAAMRANLEQLDGTEFQGVSYDANFTAGATTINGVKVDGWDVKMGGDMGDPMAGQAMAMIFGPAGGPAGFIAPANGGVVQSFGKNSVLMGQALKAAQEGSGLGTEATMAQVAERLPAGRVAEGYIGMKSLLDMAKMFAGMMGAGPIDVPEQLPPVGFAMAAGDGAGRITVFVPAPVMKATSDVVQAFQQAGGGPGGPAPRNRTGQPRF